MLELQFCDPAPALANALPHHYPFCVPPLQPHVQKELGTTQKPQWSSRLERSQMHTDTQGFTQQEITGTAALSLLHPLSVSLTSQQDISSYLPLCTPAPVKS